MILLVATTNAGKLREIQVLLAGLPFDVRLLDASADIAPPEETGRTFAENARLKARYYAHATGLPTIADDSGLEIDALDGRPGVLSARYPGATYPERFRNLYAELAARPPSRTLIARAAATVDPPSAPAGAAESADASAPGMARLSAPESPAQSFETSPADAPQATTSSTGGEEFNPAWTARFACAVALAHGDEILFETLGTVEGVITATPRGTHGFGYDPIFFYPPYDCTFGEVTDEKKSRVSARGAAFRALREFLARTPPRG